MTSSLLGALLDGKYRIERELSRGGMGIVYAATHQLLGTQVAIKVLHTSPDPGEDESVRSSSGGPTEVARFLDEARLAAALRHPNVVSVLDFGVVHDLPYLVMELVEGETLRDLLERRGKLPLSEVLPILEGVAGALAAAHGRGIVHRDLKPENILVERGDAAGGALGPGHARAKVVDFGVACLVDSEAEAAAARPGASTRPLSAGELSVRSPMTGTPAYASPEQASGHGPVTGAADLWALGVIAFECLTGLRPFAGESLGEVVLQICTWELPVPSALAEVPTGFDEWFATACARALDERFASATAQIAALARGSAAALPGGAVSPEPPRSSSTRRRGGPRVAQLPSRLHASGGRALAVLAVVAALAALAWWGIARRAPAVRAPAAAGSSAPASAPPDAPSLRVAVLPLRGPDDEPRDPPADAADASAATTALASLSASVTSALIDGLSARTPHKVIALASVTRFTADAARDVRDVMDQLAVQRLVVGELARQGDTLTLSVEVVGGDQTRVWSGRYARPQRELEQLVADAAQGLAQSLGGHRVTSAPPRDPAAYRAYLNGRYFWAKRDHASLWRAISYFREAIAIDPRYARAWVGLADAYVLLPWMGPTDKTEAYPKAREALGRALLLDPDSPEASDAHAARGSLLVEIDWSFHEAEAAFRRALELEPRNANAHQWLGELLMLFRRFDEAEQHMQLALELEPLNAAVHKNRAKVLYYAGRYAEAEAASRKAIELDPEQPWAHHGLGYAVGAQGRYDEALAILHAEPMWRPAERAPYIAVQEFWVASRRGDAAAAKRALDVVLAAKLEEATPWTMAFVYALTGERERMCRALERAIAGHDPFTPLTALDHVFDPYREEACVRDVIRKLGL
ncbi:MAG: tetratricopeptide repeat protein [Kofleriaceae bacterium]